jgi:hypothetical protein
VTVRGERDDHAIEPDAAGALHVNEVVGFETLLQELARGVGVSHEDALDASRFAVDGVAFGVALDGDEEMRTMRSGGFADHVVLTSGKIAELAHLAEDEHETSLFAARDAGGRLEPGDHRGAVGVVSVVEEPGAVRQRDEA